LIVHDLLIYHNDCYLSSKKFIIINFVCNYMISKDNIHDIFLTDYLMFEIIEGHLIFSSPLGQPSVEFFGFHNISFLFCFYQLISQFS